jgi:hypothetical protein
VTVIAKVIQVVLALAFWPAAIAVVLHLLGVVDVPSPVLAGSVLALLALLGLALGQAIWQALASRSGALRGAAAIAVALLVVGGGYMATQGWIRAAGQTAEAVEAVHAACLGTAIPAAGVLRSDGVAPNHVVVLDQAGATMEWTGSTDDTWESQSANDIELVVCVDAEEGRTAIETCPYDGPDIVRYRATREVRVIEARTGDELAHFTLTDDARECQQTEDYDLTELDGEVGWEMLETRLASLVTDGP